MSTRRARCEPPAPGFRFVEEFYQFREFSRDRVRVLLTLDTRSVNMSAPVSIAATAISSPGSATMEKVAPAPSATSRQLPSAAHPHHAAEGALWLTGEIEADAAPRSGLTAAARDCERWRARCFGRQRRVCSGEHRDHRGRQPHQRPSFDAGVTRPDSPRRNACRGQRHARAALLRQARPVVGGIPANLALGKPPRSPFPA